MKCEDRRGAAAAQLDRQSVERKQVDEPESHQANRKRNLPDDPEVGTEP